jgi:hypothetical protein
MRERVVQRSRGSHSCETHLRQGLQHAPILVCRTRLDGLFGTEWVGFMVQAAHHIFGSDTVRRLT